MRIALLISTIWLAAPAFGGDAQSIVGWGGLGHGLGGRTASPLHPFEGNDLLHPESPPMPHSDVNDKTVRVIVSW